MNKLEFRKRTLVADKKLNARSRSFYDIIVDGQSLFDQFVDSDSRYASIFGFYDSRRENIPVIEQYLLRKKSEQETGRHLLFVCPECGDIGCGAITVEVEKTNEVYIWKNFAHENDSFDLDESSFIDYPALTFDKDQYENVLSVIFKSRLTDNF